VARLKSQRRLPGACAATYQHKNLLFSTRPLAVFGSCNMRPGVIFELRWPKRIPLARPGRAGHDGKTPWHGSNHNDVCRELAQPPINTKTCSSQLDRSLCLAAVICVLESSLSFAGPNEHRWQGLDVPAMMGKRRGTAQITTMSAGSLRSQQSTQKPALRNSLARCVWQL
jgi:hypothetical protein